MAVGTKPRERIADCSVELLYRPFRYTPRKDGLSSPPMGWGRRVVIFPSSRIIG